MRSWQVEIFRVYVRTSVMLMAGLKCRSQAKLEKSHNLRTNSGRIASMVGMSTASSVFSERVSVSYVACSAE